MATSAAKPVGLVIPTRWEACDILRRYKFERVGAGVRRTSIGGRTVLVRVSGVGRKAAARAADQLVSSGAKELVSMGFCGALVPQLHVGDLVTDRIITVDKPARTPFERRALTQRAHAVAVDMETQAVIEAGTRRGVPIRVLRVVSDGYDDDLTALFGREGGFSAWRIALHLLHPKAWPVAARLMRQSRLARRSLMSALESYLPG